MTETADAFAVLAKVEAAWNEAGHTWDAQALAGLYTPDALLMGGKPEHAVGAIGIASYFNGYRAMVRRGGFSLRDQEICEIGPECFAAQGFGTFFMHMVDGGLVELELRTTLLLVRQSDGGWRIRLHHFSAVPEPVTGKA